MSTRRALPALRLFSRPLRHVGNDHDDTDRHQKPHAAAQLVKQKDEKNRQIQRHSIDRTKKTKHKRND